MADTLWGDKNDFGGTQANRLITSAQANSWSEHLFTAAMGVARWLGRGILSPDMFALAPVPGELAVDVSAGPDDVGIAIVGEAGNELPVRQEAAVRVTGLTASDDNYIYLHQDGTYTSNITGTRPANTELVGVSTTDGTESTAEDSNPVGRRNFAQTFLIGPAANRPAAERAGRFWFDPDTLTLSYDDGGVWTDISGSGVFAAIAGATFTGALAVSMASPTFRVKATGVTQPMTGVESDPTTVFSVLVNSGASGGAVLRGLTGGDVTALVIEGNLGTASPTKPAISFDCYKSNGGTGRAALAAAETMFQVRNNGSTVCLSVLGDGSATETVTDAATNAASTVFTLAHNSSGTPAVGFGGSLRWKLKSSTTNDQDAASLTAAWSTATHASRTSYLAVSTVNNAGALAEVVRWYSKPNSSANQVGEQFTGANGQLMQIESASELITLSTSGTTTDSATNLLPAGAILLAVTARVTTTITTATDWKLGDSTTAGRFCGAQTGLTAGTTVVGLSHQQGSIATDAAGPVQSAAAKLRITTTGTPGAGAIRVTVYYIVLTPSTS